ncbi:MAG: hypothetical protein ABIZ80_23265 [Bryobacteraceae bacterium]
MDLIEVFDNSEWGKEPRLLLQAKSGKVLFQDDDLSGWLELALR